ncbi:MAG: hypothetical protein WBX01_14500 [Nitrososphaeraceae archaeon]
MKSNNNRVQMGFGYQDEQYLKRYDNASADPDIQIFTAEGADDEEPETKRYWCAICKSKLTYMKHRGTIWRCDNCAEFYDTKIQDTAISNNKGFKIRPHHEINRYPKFDETDSNIPFIKSINLDEHEDPNIEITRQSDDGRIRHIHVKGSPAEALALESKTKQLIQCGHGSLPIVNKCWNHSCSSLLPINRP